MAKSSILISYLPKQLPIHNFYVETSSRMLATMLDNLDCLCLFVVERLRSFRKGMAEDL